MSWITKIKDNLVITTGDGKQYQPNWMNAEFKVEYNAKVFEFISVKGSFVDRREPKGRQYPLEFYFQGEDHLEISEAFRVSSEDKRFWTLSHPFYGTINVQPISISFDNKGYNVSKIVATVIETIENNNPKGTQVPSDIISNGVTQTNATAVSTTEANTVFESQDVVAQIEELTQIYASNKKDSNDTYFTKFQNALAKIRSNPNDSLATTQEFLLAPANFDKQVAEKIILFSSNLTSLKTNTDASTLAKNIKTSFENFGSATLAALCLATSFLDDEIETLNKNEVLNYASSISASYDSYLSELDDYQLGDGSSNDDFIPNSDSINLLNNLVNYTISNLFNIAFEAKQERFIYLEEDTNPINLTHRFYGFTDENLNKFIAENNIGLSEILSLKKDRKVVYFV